MKGIRIIGLICLMHLAFVKMGLCQYRVTTSELYYSSFANAAMISVKRGVFNGVHRLDAGFLYIFPDKRRFKSTFPSKWGLDFSYAYHNIELSNQWTLSFNLRSQLYYLDTSSPKVLNAPVFEYYPFKRFIIQYAIGIGIHKRIKDNLYFIATRNMGLATELKWLRGGKVSNPFYTAENESIRLGLMFAIDKGSE